MFNSFLDTALHVFLLWILLGEYMSLELVESKIPGQGRAFFMDMLSKEPQDKVVLSLAFV